MLAVFELCGGNAIRALTCKVLQTLRLAEKIGRVLHRLLRGDFPADEYMYSNAAA